jgi:hypothetical protein
LETKKSFTTDINLEESLEDQIEVKCRAISTEEEVEREVGVGSVCRPYLEGVQP